MCLREERAAGQRGCSGAPQSSPNTVAHKSARSVLWLQFSRDKLTLCFRAVAQQRQSVLTIGYPAGVTVTLQGGCSFNRVFSLHAAAVPRFRCWSVRLETAWKGKRGKDCECDRTTFALPNQSYNTTFPTPLSPSLSLSYRHAHGLHTHSWIQESP